MKDNAVLSSAQANYNAGTFSILGDAVVTASGLEPYPGPGAGVGTSGNPGGGSHGGRGGCNPANSKVSLGPAYDSVYFPSMPGSRGAIAANVFGM